MLDVHDEVFTKLIDDTVYESPSPARRSSYSLILTSGVDTVRTYAPHIIPLVVCAFLIPLIVVVSILAGWSVWKNASISWEAPLYLQYGDGLQPYAQIPLPPLVSQQRYDISVQLVVPLTESNVALGNFMTSLTLFTPANKTLASVRRPTIVLPPKTSLFSSTSNMVAFSVPLLQEFLPETSKIMATVELGRRDSWAGLGRGEGREVSVLTAHIRGSIVHHGIRGLVSRFPLTAALLSTAAFFIMLSVMLSAFILPRVLHRHDQPEATTTSSVFAHREDEELEVSDESASGDDERPLRGRAARRLRYHQNSGERVEIKTEEETDSIPPVRIKSEPLRRRPSGRAERGSDSE
ncbi:hypothetical protein AX15_000920 [Amanita polypyramis BW_CC]|nr:hypothetical protein AX15_000920 [Amanita polypyramis BW_CC]